MNKSTTISSIQVEPQAYTLETLERISSAYKLQLAKANARLKNN